MDNRYSRKLMNSRFLLPGLIAMLSVAAFACSSGVDAVERPPHSIGDESATVTIVEFGDFKCGHCRAFFSGAGQQIKTDFIDTGLARLEFRHFPFIGEESFNAAEATECAAEQGEFWKMHDNLMSFATPPNSGAFSEDELKNLARGIGLDGAAFDQCFDGDEAREFVQFDLESAEDLDVSSTPTFFINGIRIDGNLDYSVYRTAIQQALAAS